MVRLFVVEADKLLRPPIAPGIDQETLEPHDKFYHERAWDATFSRIVGGSRAETLIERALCHALGWLVDILCEGGHLFHPHCLSLRERQPLEEKFMTYSQLASRCLALGAVIVLASRGSGPTHGAEANFWIAQNNHGPQAPLIEVVADPTVSYSLDIWARPATGMTLGGFSLNLDSDTPGVIEFTSVEVLNPVTTINRSTRRHQLVFDSNTTWSYDDDGDPVFRNYDDEHLSEDLIEAFMGATFVNDSDLDGNGTGLGPTCLDGECMLIGGEPAWRVATVDFRVTGSLSSTAIHMEVGEHGIWHFDENPTDTSVLFGDPADGDPEDSHSWTSISTGVHTGLADAVIQVVSQLSDADFDDDGRVDGTDFRIWQNGQNGGTMHSQGDANLDGAVDDYDLQVWEAQYGSTAFGPLASVPEPSAVGLLLIALVSGAIPTRRISKQR